MANNRNRKYLVIAEVGRTGFVTNFIAKYLDAVKLAKELSLYGELFNWGEIDKICTQLKNRGYKSYQIKGNQLFFESFTWATTDGELSVCVLKVEQNKFCLKTFIRERENHSIVFESEVRWDKKWSDFFDRFSNLNLVAS